MCAGVSLPPVGAAFMLPREKHTFGQLHVESAGFNSTVSKGHFVNIGK